MNFLKIKWKIKKNYKAQALAFLSLDSRDIKLGGGDRDGEYMYIQGWFMSMYDKNHYNIVK